MKKISAKYIVMLLALLLGSLSAFAQVEEYKIEQKEQSKTLLIIDSYSDASPWSKSVIMPITYYIANNDNVHAEIYHLNSVLITDSVKYNKVHDEFLTRFGDRQIDYVIFIGQMAFTFRDEAKKHWGDDIPMLLITRDLTIADTDYYFSGSKPTPSRTGLKSITDIRNDYNLTSIYVPNYYKETIELMNSVLNGIDRLVFFIDGAYYNRALSINVETYLAENYPDVIYEPVWANAEDNFTLQYYLMHPSEHTGLLMSSWIYEKKGPFGHSILVSGDINLISSSKNPIFALRHAYMELGAIGGVYYEPSLLREDITTILDKIVSGVQPRDMRLCSDGGDPVKMINYHMLKEYDLKEKNCPKDTVMVDKPLSFWQKYSWRIITVILLITICFFVLARSNMAKSHELEIRDRQEKFIKNMPVPYSKARILYTPDMKVATIDYTIYNQAFDELKRKNESKDGDYILFPKDFISQKTTELLTTNRPVIFEHYFPATNSYIEFTLCLVGSKKKDSVDFVDSIDIFANDITKRKMDEQSLSETSKRLEMTVNIASIVPWEWDMKTDIMWMESSDLFKHHKSPSSDITSSSDPRKKEWSAVPSAEYMRMIVEEDKAEMLHAREMLILNKINQFHLEYRIKINRQGKEQIEWFDVSGEISERDEAGKPTKVIGTLMVVTERKRQENELIEAEEKARNADRMKSAFLANMSHEIRNPLNAIVGFSSLMAETEDPEKRKEYAELISENNDLLLNLINDLLDLSKIESNTLDIKKSPTDLNKLMHNVGESIKGRLKPGVALNMTDGAASCHVNIDSNRIAQVMLNLLSNASKFTTEGSITYGYTLQDNGKIRLFVKDTGIGISPVDQKRLFKRFDRINSTEPGTGIGLAISKHLIENMGGEVGIESEGKGQGSTFWFDIPYEPVDASDETPSTPSDVAKPSDVQVPVPVSKDSTSPKHKNDSGDPIILIAEDIEGNYRLLENFLNKGYILKHAWDGEEAVEMYSSIKPDLILMDISMPKLNGYQATEKIRKLDANIPIIAVTAYAYATDRKRILTSGFNDYVVKPIARETLIETINKHLEDSEE